MLAKDKNLYELRIKVIEKINNQEFLKELYRDTPEGHIRRAIVDKITDKEFLYFIYSNDPEISISIQALNLWDGDI